MKIDLNKFYRMQAVTGKTISELGLAKTTLQNIRQGKNVRPQTVYKFAKALNCEVEDIIEIGGAE